jgi:hypothetical protein
MIPQSIFEVFEISITASPCNKMLQKRRQRHAADVQVAFFEWIIGQGPLV